MNIFKNRIRAKKVIINNESSGTMRKTCIKPLSPDTDSLITGRTLTDSLLINGKYATYNSEFSNEEILDALKNANYYLSPIVIVIFTIKNLKFLQDRDFVQELFCSIL